MTPRPFREQMWAPRVGDTHPLYIGSRQVGAMTVRVVEPHRIVTEERCGPIPVTRHFAHGEAFARCYQNTADPYAVVYADESEAA